MSKHKRGISYPHLEPCNGFWTQFRAQISILVTKMSLHAGILCADYFATCLLFTVPVTVKLQIVTTCVSFVFPNNVNVGQLISQW